jgi:hypothetical protein
LWIMKSPNGLQLFDSDLTHSTVTSQREQATIDPAFNHSENDKCANEEAPNYWA